MTGAGVIFVVVVIAVMAVFSIAIANVLLPGAFRRSNIDASESDAGSSASAGSNEAASR